MNIKIKFINCIAVAIFSLSIISCNIENSNQAPIDLTVSEGLTNPIGFYNANPSFSWMLPVGVQLQTAYSIAVASSPDLLPGNADLWESGKVESSQ
ncbi:MAG: hypothetical protein R3182_07030, partial [Draconibacterium sp.]|nr:hypothetical protein [Draconibacterium sp.]